ncbi:hypothetical protein CEUSTIGMA_g2523.t1 [Chlamydomonas eustigma]|uniref:Transcription factor IIIC subunit 5 HTH domain-containing protein n=1 Tax=Chlamydomonas eustigma TaxID=1157962 RepID=A0A250WWJ9_9CHLO|nr:hypothetical protein CEUSTIGMA_g2523.t1 [Chlamydomonas eustigma]|eukprot:GAX75079.1 hypothetical protein CEUSTIGMA_g2523.t1 [Chlamydomonas eustigma]
MSRGTVESLLEEDLRAKVPSAIITSVEFPGYVRNVDRAIQMLGGLTNIAASLNNGSQNNFLRLHYRPEDTLSHPLIGDQHATQGLLLRISKTKSPLKSVPANYEAKNSAHSDETSPLKLRIVSRVQRTFKFNGLADYQYLPLDPKAHQRGQGSEDSASSMPLPPENLVATAEPSGRSEPLFVIPPLFAKTDVPMDYGYRQFKYQHPSSKGVAIVKEIGFYSSTIPEDESWSKEPPSSSAETSEAPAWLESAQLLIMTQVSQLLSVRPIWSRQLLLHSKEMVETLKAVISISTTSCSYPPASSTAPTTTETQATTDTTIAPPPSVSSSSPNLDMMLQSCLSKKAYRFRSGPWRGLYIRRGYDPRKEPESRGLQLLMYRTPSNWLEHISNEALRGDAGGGPHQEGQSTDRSERNKMIQERMDAVHRFQEVPNVKISEFQVCDLEHASIQDILRASWAVADDCTEANGWFTPAAHVELQATLDMCFQTLIQSKLQKADSHPITSKVTASPASAEVLGESNKPGNTAIGRGKRKKSVAAASSKQDESARKVNQEQVDIEMLDATTTITTAEKNPNFFSLSSQQLQGGADDHSGVRTSFDPVLGAGDGGREQALVAGNGSTSGFAGLLPASYLSALMEQMALRGSSGSTTALHQGTQEDNEDEYNLLETSEDEDDAPAISLLTDPRFQPRPLAVTAEEVVEREGPSYPSSSNSLKKAPVISGHGNRVLESTTTTLAGPRYQKHMQHAHGGQDQSVVPESAGISSSGAWNTSFGGNSQMMEFVATEVGSDEDNGDVEELDDDEASHFM